MDLAVRLDTPQELTFALSEPAMKSKWTIMETYSLLIASSP